MPSDPSNTRADADRRLKELILYIASYCQLAGNVITATKLVQVLFYSDFSAFLQLGKPITGQEYCALESGPAPRGMRAAQVQLAASGDMQFVISSIGGRPDEIAVPRRTPDLSLFSAEEISILDRNILRFLFRRGEWAEGLRRFIGWDAAELNETIRYSSAYLDAAHILGNDAGGPPKSAIEHARKLETNAASLLERYA